MVKLSVSLPDEDVAFLDAYETVWDEWLSSGDAAAWAGTSADGLVSDAPE